MTKLPIYGAMKVALHYASGALRRELKAGRIHLINVYPGVVSTEFHCGAGSNPPIKGTYTKICSFRQDLRITPPLY